MKSVILYAYPPEPDGLSLQGDLLYRGMKENGNLVQPCHLSSEFQKEWLYKTFEPDVAIGVGFWSHAPDIIRHPLTYNIMPVPWLVADGWVANYHKDIEDLPLVLATSEWVKKTYARDGVNVRNFEVAHIGIDTELFKPAPEGDMGVKTIRRMLGIEDDELMILTAGGDVTSKGAQEVLKALKRVAQEHDKWKYVCKVWGGESADQHFEAEQALIEELGDASDKVSYLEGPVSHEFMATLLNAADMYAAPSRLEGYGMIQTEAQACGVPVISINEMGPKETILHGKTGFLACVADTVELKEEWAYTHMGFDEDHKIQFERPKIFAYRASVDDLSEYILKLLTDDSLRKEMGKNARLHAEKNFEYHAIANRISTLVENTLDLRKK